ncbi:MAG: OmpH family outer membrane protein [Alphaproteobacteria bacterium]|nr:OmpH family outer membrane protein [Alphaproteobacteria bacterium]
MVKILTENKAIKSYVKTGIVAAVVVVVAALGIWGISAMRSGNTSSVSDAIAEVGDKAVTAGELRFAVIRMDAIQAESAALKDLRAQKEKYENKLRDELTKDQKELEKEKKEIEESQDVLSREALQRRVVEYQDKVTKLQRELTERAQSVEASYQKALNELQTKHLDPIIEGVINKKNLSMVIDGRMARIGTGVENLDITDEVIKAFDKKISKIKMEKPKGF